MLLLVLLSAKLRFLSLEQCEEYIETPGTMENDSDFVTRSCARDWRGSYLYHKHNLKDQQKWWNGMSNNSEIEYCS